MTTNTPDKLSSQNTYNFDTLAPGILPARFTNAVMLGEVSYELAVNHPLENIALKYRQIYPVLPSGTPDSPEKQKYYIFRTELGEMVTLCEQWISLDTVRLVKSINFNVAFKNAQPEDITRVRDVLLSMGYNNFTIN